MLVPSLVPAPLMSTHLLVVGLTMRTWPPPRLSSRKLCAPVPLHVHWGMLVPSALPAALTSRHLPLPARTSGMLPVTALGSPSPTPPSPTEPAQPPSAAITTTVNQ